MAVKKTTNKKNEVVFGIDTFGDLPVDADGELFTHAAFFVKKAKKSAGAPVGH